IGAADLLRVLIPRRWSMAARIATVSISCLTVLILAASTALIPWWLTVVAAPAVASWFLTLQIGPALPAQRALNTRRRRAAMVILFLLLTLLAVLTAELTTSTTFGIVP